MSDDRALRILLVANDGLSAGHVARMIAIAGALERVSSSRGITLRTVLATTSQAHALLHASEAVVVGLPAPVVARKAGFSDTERRRLVTGALEGIARSFSPDLVAIDTFPLGPHRELAGIDFGYARRALVRRHTVGREPVLEQGAELVDLTILAEDAGAFAESASRHVRVPPITIVRPSLSRAEARRALGLPTEGRVILVAAGGGGDETAVAHATRIARTVAKHDHVALAVGPLSTARPEGIHVIHASPLAPCLAAFDGAIAPAGYNTAHELALAGIPAALFSEPRPFDDQAARAARFEATVLETFDDVPRMKPLRPIAPGGADRAAEALLELARG